MYVPHILTLPLFIIIRIWFCVFISCCFLISFHLRVLLSGPDIFLKQIFKLFISNAGCSVDFDLGYQIVFEIDSSFGSSWSFHEIRGAWVQKSSNDLTRYTDFIVPDLNASFRMSECLLACSFEGSSGELSLRTSLSQPWSNLAVGLWTKNIICKYSHMETTYIKHLQLDITVTYSGLKTEFSVKKGSFCALEFYS